MDLTLFQILTILFVGYVGELIDSSLGMLYGTLVSALLVALGFPPLIIVPAILASEAIGGFIAAKQHHKLKNLNFNFNFPKSDNLFKKLRKEGVLKVIINATSEDAKIGILSFLFGGIFAFLGVVVAINIPELILKTYIGSISIILGTLLVKRVTFKFSFLKMVILSLISAFTNSLGGGGFGVVMTSGQVVSGRKVNHAVGITTLTESFLGLIGFLTYWLLNGIADWEIIFFLCFAAFWGAKAGPKTTKGEKSRKIKKYLGGLAILLGIIILFKAWI